MRGNFAECKADAEILCYQRWVRAERNARLFLSMRQNLTAEGLLSALRGLDGLNTAEREAFKKSEILQKLA